MWLSKDSTIEVVSDKGPKISSQKIIRRDTEECGHVLKQLIQTGLMNSEETECPQKAHTIYE